MPAARLMSISSRPSNRRPRRAQMSTRASCHAADQRIFFFASFDPAAGALVRACPERSA
jgi:hypothetical protein